MKQIEEFDAIIIGFGKGGKTLAVTLGNAGKRTILIEKSPYMYGGTCINEGCIPTKFLVHKAKQAAGIKSFFDKQAFYKQTIAEKRLLIERLRTKNLEKLVNTSNVSVITGFASLRSANQVEVKTQEGTRILNGKQIFLNTGSIPVIPDIEGIKDNPYVVTSKELLEKDDLPENLVIIGGGYIGLEFASIYADFGSNVTVIQDIDTFLPREDREIADAVYKLLENRGVNIFTDTKIKSVSYEKDMAFVTFVKENTLYKLTANTVLVATGRKPNVQNLGLENAGVELLPNGGVLTDNNLRTTVQNIYAIGDVVGNLQFTYISLDDYRIVRSAILGDGDYTKLNRGVVPYSVFLSPPFSRVGMSEQEAIDKGYSVKTARLPASAIPKALVTEQPAGILKAVIDKQTGLILGAHLFCEESHEMINTVKLAIDAKLPYTVFRDMIFTHPTMSEALNDLFNV